MGFKFMHLNKFDTAADEKRLEVLAAKGEFIKWNAGFLAYFKKAEPRKLKYNLVKKYQHAANAAVIFCYVLMAVLIFMPVVFFPMTTGGKVHITASLPLLSWFLMTYLKMFPIYIIEMIVVLAEFLNSAKAGRFISGCIENKNDAEKAVRSNNILTAVYIFLWGIYAVIVIILGLCINMNEEEAVAFTDVPSQAITIDKVYGENNIKYISTDEEAKKYLDPEIFDGDIKAYGFHANSVRSIVTNEAYYYGQHAAYSADGREMGNKVYISGSYAEFKSESLAEKCSKEIMEYESFFFSNAYDSEPIMLDTSDTVFDTGYCLTDKNKVLLSFTKDDELYTVRVNRLEENGLTAKKVIEDILNNYR